MPISRNRRPAAPEARPSVQPPVPPGRRPPGRRRATPRARIVQRVLIALMAGLALLVLERMGLLNRLSAGVMPAQLNWSNDYQLVEYFRTVVVQDGLTHDAKDCLLFVINGNDPPNAVRMEVLEKHSGSCPGTRGQLPKLFTLKVDRLAHSVQTDAGSPGLFHPLP
jgi:hypothetical protein